MSEVVQYRPRIPDTRGSDPQPVAGDVVDITAGRPHSVGAAQCRKSPDHRWTAVVLSVSNPWLLECPICRKMTGHIPGACPETPYEAKVWAEEIYQCWAVCNGVPAAWAAQLPLNVAPMATEG